MNCSYVILFCLPNMFIMWFGSDKLWRYGYHGYTFFVCFLFVDEWDAKDESPGSTTPPESSDDGGGGGTAKPPPLSPKPSDKKVAHLNIVFIGHVGK